jgi:hypothetical protein
LAIEGQLTSKSIGVCVPQSEQSQLPRIELVASNFPQGFIDQPPEQQVRISAFS